MTGAYFHWTPAILAADSATLTPWVTPQTTTDYILTVSDTLGCPKPVSDSVLITVIPPVIVQPGNDTAVVIGQPLQLHATSTDSALVTFGWSPADWLNETDIADPVATITSVSVDSVVYLVTAATPQGCSGSGKLTVLVYKTLPDIFMPNAFSPNGDGKNDVIRPILVGISRLDYFRIFDRWGQEVFATTQSGKGWDGTVGGHKAGPGAFVYSVQGVDYTGKVHVKKGTLILVR
jgi:gliding motility-associated-like protein